MATPSTTEFIPIAEISDGVLALKDGSLRAVVQISAVNFDLRSTDEQKAIIQQFQGFLNSVDFPFQVVVQSRRFDVSAYLTAVKNAAENLSNELLKVQANEYARFVGELSELANIMSKNFYVVLPFTIQQQKEKNQGFIKSLFGSSKPPKPSALSPEQLAAAKTQMLQRADLIIGGLSGMGLQGRVLGDPELTTLLRDLYNPNLPESRENPS